MITLYIVATPIGNLDDLSLRSVKTLREVQIILCEDTRVTRRLLSHFQIPARAVWRIQEKPRSLEHLAQALEGRPAALVSDSGTPGISDPGARLIEYLVRNVPEARIIPIPGPSALTAALSISGMGRDGHVFLGYLGRSKSKILKEISRALDLDKAVVFYESPYRIQETLSLLAEAFPQAGLLVARELTKQFEQLWRGTPAQILHAIESQKNLLGEFTVVMEKKNAFRISASRFFS